MEGGPSELQPTAVVLALQALGTKALGGLRAALLHHELLRSLLVLGLWSPVVDPLLGARGLLDCRSEETLIVLGQLGIVWGMLGLVVGLGLLAITLNSWLIHRTGRIPLKSS